MLAVEIAQVSGGNRFASFPLLSSKLAATIDTVRIPRRSLHLLNNHHYNGRESFKGYEYYFLPDSRNLVSDSECCRQDFWEQRDEIADVGFGCGWKDE
jgi:hypothetical protein